jgi:hypothetical protein
LLRAGQAAQSSEHAEISSMIADVRARLDQIKAAMNQQQQA